MGTGTGIGSVPLSLTLFWDTQREVHPSLVVASDLAPTRAPHHPAPPRATTFRETTPPPGNGAVDTRAGWWARRYVVARGWVGGGWALVGARRRVNRNMSGKEMGKLEYWCTTAASAWFQTDPEV